MLDSPWSSLPERWLHVDLPGYRESPKRSTYAGWPLENQPPVPSPLDDDFSWLRNAGIVHAEGGWDRYEYGIRPGNVVEMARPLGITLPASFAHFMTSPELQSRVRSCTLCYLDPGERIVETVGTVPGYLVHFLSDSQSCAHWYLHILRSGEHCVLEADDLYGLQVENSQWIENPACRLEQINLEGLNFVRCAGSFSEFLYRFWIENEIWFALSGKESRRDLNSLELAYVRHYEVDQNPVVPL